MKRGKSGRRSGKGVNVLYKNIPFVFFLVGLGLIYIANNHYAEKKVRKIEGLKSEVKTLKWEYWSLRSEIMHSSTQSELSRKVEVYGLQTPDDSPKRIIVAQAEK
ncbi:MAG: FtsL-like putative cell division protein [Saprospiraceae bacterium]|nr:FtsL-like putative cell division protein [Saprospiraceae bacterium]